MGVLSILVQTALLSLIGIYIFFGLVYLFTGIRIKRVGYLSIRWIRWVNRSESVVVEIRKIGLRPQRPTITRRTWLGIVISDARITIRPGPTDDWSAEEEEHGRVSKKRSTKLSVDDRIGQIGKVVAKLGTYTALRWVDLEFSSTTLVIEGAGTFQMGMFLLGMNSKPQMFRRERILTTAEGEEKSASVPRKEHPLEVTVTIRDLYFAINNKDFLEIAKTMVLNSDFLLGGEYGIHGVKAALRISGLSIPYDNLLLFLQRIKEIQATNSESSARPWSPITSSSNKLGSLDIVEELQVCSLLSQRVDIRFISRSSSCRCMLVTCGPKESLP